MIKFIELLYCFYITISVDLSGYDFSGLARYFFLLFFKTFLVRRIISGMKCILIIDLILGNFYLLIQHIIVMQQIVSVCNVIFANYYLAEEIYLGYYYGSCRCYGMNY
jgi:hypothetical protein